MKQALGIFLMAFAFLAGGCSSVEYNSTNSPRMIVDADRTPFFHNGPAQGNGPDLSLVKGDIVEVLRKEIGYSFVRIEDGQNGYVSNEALAPAPVASAPTSDKPKASRVSAPQAGSQTNQPSNPIFRY